MGEQEELDKRISIHEAVCAERYAALITRMGRIEKIILSIGGAIATALLMLLVNKL